MKGNSDGIGRKIIYKEGLPNILYEEMRKYFTIYDIYEEAVIHIWLCNRSPSEFPYIWGKFDILFYQCDQKNTGNKYARYLVQKKSEYIDPHSIPSTVLFHILAVMRLPSFLDWIPGNNGIRAVSLTEFLEEMESGKFPRLNSLKKWNQSSFLDWIIGKNWIRAVS